MVQAIAGAVAAPVWSLRNFVDEFFWIWLHLLAFTISNQSCSQTAVIEDATNKPDRPIPSGRLSLFQARVLRWSLVPVCLLVSYQVSTSVLAASAAVIAITAWYNELGGSGNHWIIRNLLNGIGFGAFISGATLLAGTLSLSRNFPSRVSTAVYKVRIAHSSTSSQRELFSCPSQSTRQPHIPKTSKTWTVISRSGGPQCRWTIRVLHVPAC